MAPTSPSALDCTHAAGSAWNDLVRAIKASSLHEVSHPQVRPFLEGFARGIQQCCQWVEPVVFNVTEQSLEFDGFDLVQASQFPRHLLGRLHHDGVRRLHFRSSFTARGAGALAAALAPYANFSTPPSRSLSDVLKWAGVTGLTLGIVGRNSLDDEPTNQAQLAWYRRLMGPGHMPEPEHLPEGTRLAAVWDGRKGQIPWPLPVDDSAIAVLRGEVAKANSSGVPMLNLGTALADICELWPDDERINEMLNVCISLVDGLLQAGQPEEASRLLQPMSRWVERANTTGPSAALKLHISSFMGFLTHDTRLRFLLEGVQQERFEPVNVASWFAALPSTELRHALRFATVVPRGPARDSLLEVTRELAARCPQALETVIRSGTAAEAVLAIEAAELLRDLPQRISMACAAMERSELTLARRGAQLVDTINDPAVRAQMTRLMLHPSYDLRSLALRYVHCFRLHEAATPLEELVTSAPFRQRPLPERILIGLAYGAAAGERAAEIAVRSLGDDWRYSDTEQSAPWILCLASTGDPRALKPLDWLEAQRVSGLQTAITDARKALLEHPSSETQR